MAIMLARALDCTHSQAECCFQGSELQRSAPHKYHVEGGRARYRIPFGLFLRQDERLSSRSIGIQENTVVQGSRDVVGMPLVMALDNGFKVAVYLADISGAFDVPTQEG